MTINLNLKMKKLSIKPNCDNWGFRVLGSCFVGLAMLAFISRASALENNSLFDNLSAPVGIFMVGNGQVGDEIILNGGQPSLITQFAFEYYGSNFLGGELARVVLYKNDDSAYGATSYQMPGSTIWDSGFFSIPGTISPELGTNALITFDLTGDYPVGLLVPGSFTWSVLFSGIGEASSVGTIFSTTAPAVGLAYSDYWVNAGTFESPNWVLQQNPSYSVDFLAQVVGQPVPEPSTVSLAISGIAMAAGIWLRRRFVSCYYSLKEKISRGKINSVISLVCVCNVFGAMPEASASQELDGGGAVVDVKSACGVDLDKALASIRRASSERNSSVIVTELASFGSRYPAEVSRFITTVGGEFKDQIPLLAGSAARMWPNQVADIVGAAVQSAPEKIHFILQKTLMDLPSSYLAAGIVAIDAQPQQAGKILKTVLLVVDPNVKVCLQAEMSKHESIDSDKAKEILKKTALAVSSIAKSNADIAGKSQNKLESTGLDKTKSANSINESSVSSGLVASKVIVPIFTLPPAPLPVVPIEVGIGNGQNQTPGGRDYSAP